MKTTEFKKLMMYSDKMRRIKWVNDTCKTGLKRAHKLVSAHGHLVLPHLTLEEKKNLKNYAE